MYTQDLFNERMCVILSVNWHCLGCVLITWNVVSVTAVLYCRLDYQPLFRETNLGEARGPERAPEIEPTENTDWNKYPKPNFFPHILMLTDQNMISDINKWPGNIKDKISPKNTKLKSKFSLIFYRALDNSALIFLWSVNCQLQSLNKQSGKVPHKVL